MNLRLLALANAIALLSGMTQAAEIVSKHDMVSISVTGVPANEKVIVSGTYPISAEGFLNLPVAGRIPVTGLTYAELGKLLDRVFLEKGIYREARCNVWRDQGCPMKQEFVLAGGLVNRPGPVPYSKGLTMLHAIEAAGGCVHPAKPGRVKIQRNGDSRIYDLQDTRWKAFLLQRNDTVEVLDAAEDEGGKAK